MRLVGRGGGGVSGLFGVSLVGIVGKDALEEIFVGEEGCELLALFVVLLFEVFGLLCGVVGEEVGEA